MPAGGQALPPRSFQFNSNNKANNMKKIFFGSLVLLVSMLTACSDDYGWDATPQTSPEETAQTVSFGDGSVTEANPIDLANLTMTDVQVCRIVAPSVTDKGTSTTYKINFTDPAAGTYDISAEGYMSVAELTKCVESAFGKAPVRRTLQAKITAFIVKNGQVVKVTSNAFKVYATPDAPTLSPIGYYVVGNCQLGNEWNNKDTSFKYEFNGADPYTLSVITFRVSAPADGSNLEFKVLDLNNLGNWDAATVLACSEAKAIATDGSEKGKFVDNTNGKGKNMMGKADAEAKFYDITLDLINQTYTIKSVKYAEYLYLIGNNSDWTTGTALYGPASDGKYYGAVKLTSSLKFRSNLNDWAGSLNLGLDGSNPQEGKLVNSGSSKDISATAGFYFITVDAAAMTYTLTPFTAMHAVGSAVGDWGAGVTMTYNNTNHTWEAKNVTMTDGELKFKDEDASWKGVNLGGSLDKLAQGAGNLTVRAGTYDIVLHLENQSIRAPYAVLTAK